MTIHQLRQAAENFFVEPYEFTAIGNSTGYSGSQMAQVIDAQGQIWCVRLWVDESIETLRFMHRVLQHSVAQGVCGLPHLVQNETGDSLIAIDSCWAEAQSWIPPKLDPWCTVAQADKSIVGGTHPQHRLRSDCRRTTTNRNFIGSLSCKHNKPANIGDSSSSVSSFQGDANGLCCNSVGGK